MKHSILATVAVGVCGVLLPTAEAATTQCLRLTNSTASIYSAISFIADKNSDLAHLPLNELMAPLDTEYPWLSTCLASANIMTIGVGLLSDPVKSKCVSSLTGSSSSNSTSLLGGGDSLATSLCPSLNSTLFPCVNNVLVDTINQLITSGGDCCTEMSAKIKEGLGQDLKTFVAKLMDRVGDVICSVKTYVDPVDGKTKNSTCGDAIIGAVGGGDLFNLIEMVQLPNDQACAAMKGQNFTATTGGTFQFFESQTPIDSCYAPLNNLFTDLAKLPMISNSTMSPMFDAGKCRKGETIITMALDEKSLVQGFAEALDKIVTGMKLAPTGEVTRTVRAGFADWEKDFGPMCFHIANGVTNCAYNSTVAYAFSTDAPPPSTSSSGGSTTPTTGSSGERVASQSAVLLSVAALLSVSAMMQ